MNIQEESKRLMEATLVIEMEKAAHILRFRNIPEERQQDLMETISKPLAELMDIETKQMENEIDQIFRINSSFAK